MEEKKEESKFPDQIQSKVIEDDVFEEMEGGEEDWLEEAIKEMITQIIENYEEIE